MGQAQRGLDQSGGSGRGLQMPEVGLHGAQVHRRAVGPPVDIGQRLGLDGVTEPGAGAVRLDQSHLVRCDAAGGEGGPVHLALGGAVGGGDAGAAAVLVDRSPADHGEDAVPVAHGVGEPLEDDDPTPLAPYVAVRVVGEGARAAPPGHRAERRLGDQQDRGEHHVDASGQCRVALAGAQALARLVHRDQGGGTGGVERDVGAAQVEEVGDTAGDEAERGAGTGVGGDVLGAADPGGHMVRTGHAHEHAGTAARQPGRGLPGVLQRLPRHLQRQPLMGVHGQGLAAGDAEEVVVEAVDTVQESAAAGVDRACLAALLVVEGRVVPPVRRDVADGVDPAGEQLPVGVGVGDAAGEPAAHAHDGDRLAARALVLLDPALEPLHGQIGAPEGVGRSAALFRSRHR